MPNRHSNPHTVEHDADDAHILPGETVARREREGANYQYTPKSDADSVDRIAGYAVDSEGLVNNYAVEPEMYFEVPGDTEPQSAAYLATHEQEENFGDAQSQLDADAAAHETQVAESKKPDDTADLSVDM